MNPKSKYLSFTFLFTFFLFGLEVLYMSEIKTISKEMLEKKILFVEFCGLPDLAISTEAAYVRHRTLSTVFSIYKDDASLREYLLSTYAISHSHLK